jgi:serine/threonine protein kinase
MNNADTTLPMAQPPISSSTDSQPQETLLLRGAFDPPATPGTLGLLDRFEILRLLGEGGMGQVYLAREPRTDTRVAIKIMRPQMAGYPQVIHSFLTEARHMYRLSHPRILRVLEVSDRKEGPYFVMPYIEGGSLLDQYRSGRRLPEDRLLSVARQVAEALAHAHARGLIHRDLKPGNVLLDKDGNAYLTDFGLVRTVFNDSMIDASASCIEGTVPYMSPAVARGEAEDTRCDIYAFGALLYELLTGQQPYSGRTPQIILAQVLQGPPPPIREVNPKASPALVRIAEGCMARELRDRYASMADVVSDLDRTARNQAPFGPHRQGSRRRPLRLAAALLGALLLAGVFSLAIFLKKREENGKPPAPPATPLQATKTQLKNNRVERITPYLARANLDMERYSLTQLREIEALYISANRNWNSPEAKKNLETLISKYGKANQTGCAILYLGQMSAGEEKEKYLRQAIYDHSDCWYSDGVAVGAYSRFLLAQYYQQIGKKAEALNLLEKMQKDYPDAIDHTGKPLANKFSDRIGPGAAPGDPNRADPSQLKYQNLCVTRVSSGQTLSNETYRYQPDGRAHSMLLELQPTDMSKAAEIRFEIKKDEAYGPFKITLRDYGDLISDSIDITEYVQGNRDGFQIVRIPATAFKTRGWDMQSVKLLFIGDQVRRDAGGPGFTIRAIEAGFSSTPSDQRIPSINLQTASTQIPYTYTTNNGAITITKYTGSGGEVTIPSTISGLPVTGIAAQAFFNCRSLTCVTIPPAVTHIGYMALLGCTNLATITVAAANTNYNSLNGVLFDKGQTTLIQYPVGKTGSYVIPAGVTRVEPSAFSGCTGLTGITIPASLASIGAGAFSGCSGLAGIYFKGDVPELEKWRQSGNLATETTATVYYLPGAKGWGKEFGGRPTAVWDPEKTQSWAVIGDTKEEALKKYGEPKWIACNDAESTAIGITRAQVQGESDQILTFFTNEEGKCILGGIEYSPKDKEKSETLKNRILEVNSDGKSWTFYPGTSHGLPRYERDGAVVFVFSGKNQYFVASSAYSSYCRTRKAELKQNKIVEGEGWRGFRVGATREALIKELGAPDADAKGKWLKWKKHSVHCVIDDQRGASELRFDDGFTGETTAGIGIGSTLKQALAAYGEPTTSEDKGKAKKLIWTSKGILIWFNEDKVSQIVVFQNK